MCIVMYKKVVLLEISRNSLLTRVRDLQSMGCNTNSQQNFLKLFQKFPQGSRKSSVSEFLFSKLQAYKLQPSALQVFKILKNSGNSVYWGVFFPEAGAKTLSEKPASVSQKDSSMAVLLRSFLTFLKKLFFKKSFVHTEISTEYKNVSEYKNFSEFKY